MVNHGWYNVLSKSIEGTNGNGSKDRSVFIEPKDARVVGYIADRMCDEIDVDFYEIWLDPIEELTINLASPLSFLCVA